MPLKRLSHQFPLVRDMTAIHTDRQAGEINWCDLESQT